MPLLRFLRLVVLVAVAAILFGGEPAAYALSDTADAPHIHLQLVVPGEALAAGKAANPAGLTFKMEPGWHIYWTNPGDAGAPPTVKWTLPAGVTATELEFPAPELLPLGPLMDYGYPNEVFFPFRLKAEQPSSQPVTLRAHVEWLVCRESCLPGRADLEVSRAVNATHPVAASALPAIFKAALQRIPKALPPEAKASFVQTATGFRIVAETGRSESKAHFFPLEADQVDNPAAQKFKATATGFELEVKRDPTLTATPKQLKGVLELAGGRNFVVTLSAGQQAAAALPTAGTPTARSTAVVPQQSAAPSATPVPATPQQSAPSLGRALLLAFFGGMILNLMPCVFPVLFLKGLALVNSGREDRRSLRLHGAVYTLGILVSLWLLAGVLEALRAAGAVLGWGFQFQSPAFVLLLSGLLFFLALSLAGLFEIGLGMTSAGGELANRQGFTGSFFTGILAVIVATPCTAPMMGVAMGFALAAPAAVAFAVFTALALGLAAPYVALTLQPAWTRFLPRPGVWMELLRQAVSIPLFATVIWLSWVLVRANGAGIIPPLMGSLLLLSIAGWFWGRWPLKRWAKVVGVVVLLGVLALDLAAPKYFVSAADESESSSAALTSAAGWQKWSAEAEANARAKGEPVFVDYTASWCLSCQVNQRVALDRPEVQAAFAGKHVLLLKADWTRRDEAITRSLVALGRSGVPAYVLYLPTEKAPVLLPEALTPSTVLQALDRIH